MSDAVFPVPENWAANSKITADIYSQKYARSIQDIDGFWRDEAQRLDWIRPFETVKDTSYDKDCLLYTSPSPRDRQKSRMPSSA